jgi:hypothetical protein
MLMVEFQLSSSLGSRSFQGERHRPYGTTFQDTTTASIAVFMLIIRPSIIFSACAYTNQLLNTYRQRGQQNHLTLFTSKFASELEK